MKNTPGPFASLLSSRPRRNITALSYSYEYKYASAMVNPSDLYHPDGEPQGERQGGHDQDQGADSDQVGTQAR